MKQLPIMGGAPRGKRAGSDPEKASPRGRASHRKYAVHAAPLWEARPAANAEGLPAQEHMLRPEVGPPTEKYAVHAAPVGGATRGESGGLPAQKHKLRPRSGLPQKYALHVVPVGGATRGESGGLPAQKQKLRPEVGPPTENMHCTRRHGEARPAANAEGLPAQEHMLRPEVGPPTEKYAVHAAPVGGATRGESGGLPAQKHKLRPGGRASHGNMQCTWRRCGRRNPRRKRRSARSKAHALPRDRASDQRSGARRPICGASYSPVAGKQSPVSSRPDERCGAAPARVAARTGATRVQPLRHEL